MMHFREDQKQQLLSELVFAASRSSGPGGQNVNKVSSKVELRFSIQKSQNLTEEEKQIIRSKLSNRINSDDELVLTAQSSRSQLQNKEEVINLFFNLLEKALTPRKKRIKTTPTRASREKRLETKKKAAQKKALRKPPEI